MKNSNENPPRNMFGITGTFKTSIEEEIEQRLAGDRYINEFRKMANNDSICGAVLLAITKTFQSITWEPFNDEKEVLERSLKNVNWNAQLEEILTFLIFGHSVFEVVYKEEDGLVLWDGLYTRPQNTLAEFVYDKRGDIQHIVQSSEYGNSDIIIPINKCLHFGASVTRNNPRGKSIFRNAYRDWYYRTNIEKIEAIGIERDLTGLPVLKAAEGDELFTETGEFNQIAKWAWETVRNVKRNSQEGLVIPPGWEFSLIGSPGKRQFDLNEVIKRYDAKIALSMLSQFLVLGVVNSSGSFALSKDQSHLFYKAVEGFANMVCNVVNNQFIGAPCMALMNDVEAPTLMPVGIDKPSLSDLASFLGRLLKFNVIEPDDHLETYLRREAGLPEKDPETARPAAVAKPVAVEVPEPGNDDKKKDDEEELEGEPPNKPTKKDE